MSVVFLHVLICITISYYFIAIKPVVRLRKNYKRRPDILFRKMISIGLGSAWKPDLKLPNLLASETVYSLYLKFSKRIIILLTPLIHFFAGGAITKGRYAD